MIQVDGSAPLSARRSYLKRRRSGRLGTVAMWAGAGMLGTWISLMLLVGLAH